MNKNILIIIVATMMLLSSLAVIADYNGNTSGVNTMALPSVVSGKAYVGNVTIYANGTASSATEISQSGNSYSLNNNLNGTLIDMRNDSVVSGNEFTINGMGLNGFNVIDASSVQISDFNVTNSTTGAYLLDSKSVTIKDSHISAGKTGIYGNESDHFSISSDRISVPTGNGIYVEYTSESFVNSTFIDASIGYYASSSTTITAFNNDTFSASSYAIYTDGVSNNNMVIANSTIKGNGTSSYGIYLSSYNSNNVKIVSNRFANFTSEYAVYIDSGGSTGYVMSHNDFANTANSIYLFTNNALVSGNHFTNVTSYAIYVDFGVNITISGNTITNASSAEFIFAEYSVDLKVYGNSISNTSTAIYMEYSNHLYASDNSITKSQYGVYLYSDESMDNVNVSGNRLVNITSSAILIEVYSGTNFTVDNNIILNSSYPIYIYYVIQYLKIDGNSIFNSKGSAIYVEYASAFSISGNVISGLHGPAKDQLGIDVEYFVEGIISNNIITGNSSAYGAEGIYVVSSTGFSVFGNTVSNVTYGMKMEYSGSFSVFSNTVMNNPTEKGTYGIYSYENSQFSYFSNAVSGSNYSIASYYDFAGLIYGNTFSNANNYTIYLNDSLSLTFYHNNFLNGSRINTYFNGASNLVWNISLPVGGNYWSNYSGTGTGGIGSTPYKVNGTSVDYLPLTAKWEGYTITFVESGLPVGTAWSVTLGSSAASSETQIVAFSLDAAQHITQDYTVARISGYVVSESKGQITLNGTSQVITLTFTPVTYNVTFTETGLPSGTAWSVTVGSQKLSSSSSAINFLLFNGTYNYTIGSVTGYHMNAVTGSFQINASGKAINASFVQNKYTLLVTETGLPAGNTWAVNVSGSTTNSTGNSVEIYLVSGTYSISVTGTAGYNVTLSAGSVTINNANATVSAVFKNITVAAKPSSSGAVYEGLGVGVIIGAVVGILVTMMYSGTWIFRKGKSGNQ